MKGSPNVARKRLLTVLATFLGLVAAFVILEGGVRLMMPQEDIAEWFQRNTELGFSLKPDYRQAFRYPGYDFTMKVKTNSHGFRDEEVDWSLPFDGPRVVFLGDSFVFGYGIQVEDRVDTRLAAFCAEGGNPIQTINCGTPGWGTRQETAYALEHLEALHPDIIALFFCENDPANDRGLLAPVLSDEKSLLFWPKLLLRRHTHTYRFILRQKFLFKQRRLAAPESGSPLAARFDVQSASAIREEDWRNTLSSITRFHRAFLEHNPDGVLLIVSTSPDNEDIQKHLSSLSFLPNLSYVDLGERYSEVSPDDRRTPWDGHWSPQIHDLAAEELYAWLVENLFTSQ